MSMIAFSVAAALFSTPSIQDAQGKPEDTSELETASERLRHTETEASNGRVNTDRLEEQSRIERQDTASEDQASTAPNNAGNDNQDARLGVRPSRRVIDRASGNRPARIPD